MGSGGLRSAVARSGSARRAGRPLRGGDVLGIRPEQRQVHPCNQTYRKHLASEVLELLFNPETAQLSEFRI